MNTSRPLDSMEQALILTEQLSPLTVVGVMRLSNGPTPMKLREALSILQRRLPVLQARIEQEDDRQILAISPDTPPIPMQHQTRQDDEQWRAVVDSELNRQVETNPGPLLRCTYLSSPNGDALSELVLAFHHVLVDAVAGLHLCHLLLEVCQMAGATETAEDAATVQALPHKAPGAVHDPPIGG
jgi:NRPS condensation-like uncharacterized protein